tara:strand:+ start:172 stop:402 length:231 start_codon:yes stop_codon:yes gene_type:complete
MNKRKEFIELLNRYDELRDQLMNYTMTYFDSMGYDIDGYSNSVLDGDISNIDDLRNQVESFELILGGLIKINYIFG